LEQVRSLTHKAEGGVGGGGGGGEKEEEEEEEGGGGGGRRGKFYSRFECTIFLSSDWC
jgi:hypothetical protein